MELYRMQKLSMSKASHNINPEKYSGIGLINPKGCQYYRKTIHPEHDEIPKG